MGPFAPSSRAILVFFLVQTINYALLASWLVTAPARTNSKTDSLPTGGGLSRSMNVCQICNYLIDEAHGVAARLE